MADSFDTHYMAGNTFEVFQQLKSQAFISRFTIVGGTALAIQIRHRLSEDLDFISDEEGINPNLINLTKEMIPGLSPVTYTETLVYTNDIEEEDISAHLSPAENVNKDQIAAFSPGN